MKKEIKKTKIIKSDVYCFKCGRFLGMTCDLFREEYCERCFRNKTKKKNNQS